MTTVIFVHGISVREPQFSQTFEKIKNELQNKLPNLKIVPCLWGDSLGAKLNADGASIPLYDSTRNDAQRGQDENLIRWMQLYKDPLYELRLLSLKTPEEQEFIPSQEDPSEKIDEKVKQLNLSEELQAKLKEGGIACVFEEAYQNVVRTSAYREALKTISDETLIEYRDAIARAIIAESIAICERQEKYTGMATDANLREEVVKFLSCQILESERGVGDWLKENLSKLVLSQTTNHLKRKRGVISDITYPAVGDILLYQGRGQKIRNLIQKRIEEVEEPVVLLAHSLGGIACVDLLVKEQLEQVKLLVTVGSQAPYFYEINALQSLEFGQALPEDFPEWLNIYDLKDFFSFIGGNVFPNKIQDIPVDNQQPFPQSHSAYWTNKATWKAIIGRIKEIEI